MDIKEAIMFAKLWGAGKMVGGNGGDVISALLKEIDCLRSEKSILGEPDNSFRPAVFECVYYCDRDLESFRLAGIFTLRRDAEACKKEIEKDPRLGPVSIAHRTLAALQKEFIDDANVNFMRGCLYQAGLPVAVAPKRGASGEALKQPHDWTLPR